jgi:hypothetical protein
MTDPITREDERDAFVENELKPMTDAIAADMERQLRAEGFDVTVTWEDDGE